MVFWRNNPARLLNDEGDTSLIQLWPGGEIIPVYTHNLCRPTIGEWFRWLIEIVRRRDWRNHA